MWESEEVPRTKAQFVVQSICIEPILVTPDDDDLHLHLGSGPLSPDAPRP